MKENLDMVKNIYPEEQDALEELARQELEVRLKVNQVLYDHGFTMYPIMDNGMPAIEFTKE